MGRAVACVERVARNVPGVISPHRRNRGQQVLRMPVPINAWYVIRTHWKQEFRVEQNLRAGGIEVFLPRVYAGRSWFGQRQIEIAALFPQYLFARFDPETRLCDVLFTRGVQAPLRVAGSLAIVDGTAIAFLQSRVQSDGIVHIDRPLQPGERVIIEGGPFEALVGVVSELLPERDRVMILLSTIGVSLRLNINVHAVRRLPNSRTQSRSPKAKDSRVADD